MISAMQLDEAVEHHAPLERIGAPPATLAEAYDLQRAFVARRSERTGSRPSGYKIAFTSPAAQSAVATGGYASGVLLESDILRSGATVRLSERFTPILEVELAIRVLEDIDGDTPLDEVAERTEVAAAVEIPESRFANWFGGEYPALSVTEVVGDNCLAGLVVVGSDWTPTSEVDLTETTATLHFDGELVRSGSVGLVVPGPVAALSWLAGQLAARGDGLSAGHIISSGTWTDTIRLSPGRYVAAFGSGIGDVSIDIVP